MTSIYDKLSKERKELQEKDLAPSHWSTGAYQLFKEKYQYQADNPREQYVRIARTLAAHTKEPGKYQDIFFDLMWKGWLSPSTPVLANTGTTRGLPVSCAGDYVGDDLSEIYKAKHETAMLTKMGFGTASYLGDIRPRGSNIGTGGKSSGVLPIIKGFHGDMDYVVQGTARRGSWAGYLPIDHGDFDEVNEYLRHHPDGNNIGWNISKDFLEKLSSGDKEANRRYGEVMKTKMITGKGYFWFNDKVNDLNPQWYKDQGLSVKSSQLCSEIALHSDEEHTFTCVLASMNLMFYNEWKDTDAVFNATIFLDAVCQEFIERAKNIEGLEKAVRFTKKSRALGLGVCGFHTYLQQEGMPFGDLRSHLKNIEIFKLLDEESKKASKYLAETWGEPEWMKGYGYANTHRCVSGDTPILTRDGQVKIKELVGKNVTIWNGTNWSEVRPFETGINKLYRVVFSNGLYLDCTEDHKFLIATASRDSGGRFANKTVEVETKNLRKGDCLPKFPVEPTNGTRELPYAYTAGLFCGDGSINCAREGKYPRNELRLYGDKKGLADKVDWKSKNTWGVDGCVRGYLPDDILPKFVVPFNYSEELRKKWLCGLIDADGTKSNRGISISMKDYSFARDVALLIQSLGGEPSITTCKRTGGFGSPDNNQYYVVNVSQFSCGKIFTRGDIKPFRVTVEGVPKPVTNVGKGHFVEVVSIEDLNKEEMTYCFTENEYGTGVFGGILTKQCAVAPTKSTALLMGGVSEGINPDTAMVYTQRTPAGEVDRVNPVLLKLMKERGVYNKQTLQRIRVDNFGSVQNEDWLTDEEKEVFKIAFEINMHDVIRLASTRSKYIDQWQSLNLFFAGDADPEYINSVHQEAFLDPLIKGLYYVYSRAGVQASIDKDECTACQ